MKTKAKPTPVVVKTLYDRVSWMLGTFLMAAGKKEYKPARAVSRAEIFRGFRGALKDNRFEGMEERSNARAFVGTWRFDIDEKGRLSLGCQHFGKQATNRIRKWANGVVR